MADKIIITTNKLSASLYAHIRNSSGAIWNGSAFEAYNASNWATYDVALTEDGSSGVHLVAFPAAISADGYTIITYRKLGASPLESDTIIGAGTTYWDGTYLQAAAGSTHTAENVAALILNDPTNKLAVDSSGEVTANNMRGTDSAYTGTPPTVGAIADQVWDEIISAHTAGGSFGAKNQKVVPSETLADYKANVTNLDATVSSRASSTEIAALNNITAAAAADAVWDEAAGDHVLAGSFGLEEQLHALSTEIPTPPTVGAISDQVWDEAASGHVVSGSFGDKLANKVPSATLADYKADVTALALEATVAALNDPTAAAIATAVMGATVDGTLTMTTGLKALFAAVFGNFTRTGSDPLVFAFKDDAGTSTVVTLSVPLAATSRTKS